MATRGVVGQLWDSSSAPVVTATGVATSLGRRAANAVAAYRCRLSRTSPSTELKVMDNGTALETPVLVHQVTALTEGFEQFGRWLRLARAAAADLAAEHDLGRPRRVGVLAVLPELDANRFPEFVEDEAALPTMVGAAFPREWRTETAHIEHGELAFARALYTAAHGVLSGWDRAAILGADSLVDQRSLGWLQSTGRLKSDENPVGLVPGEAGACLVLEPRAVAEQRGARVRARVRAAVICEDTTAERVDDRASRNLAACLRTALTALNQRVEVAMFTDLNGETSRAVRLGTAMTFLTDLLADPIVEHPAECFGETGVAFGALSTCLAIGAYDRGYARSPFAVVVNTDNAGNASCVVLERP